MTMVSTVMDTLSVHSSFVDSPSVGTFLTDMVPRILYLTVGLGGGFILFLPNAMMCDSGSHKSNRASFLGLCACLAFGCGGVYGALYLSNFALVFAPGIALQILAFIQMG